MKWNSPLLLSLLLAAILLPALVAPGVAFAESRSATVAVDGMSCAFCAHSLQKRLKKSPGVSRAKVLFDAGKVELEFRPEARLDIDRIRKDINDGGYTPRAAQVVVAGDLVQTPGRGWDFRASATGQTFRIAAGEGLERALTASRDGRQAVVVTGALEKSAGALVLAVSAVRVGETPRN